jgi:hypothetical protein
VEETQRCSIGVRLTPAERQRLESLRLQAGLPTLTSVVRLLINQSDGILPPRVVGRSSRQTTERRREYSIND